MISGLEIKRQMELGNIIIDEFDEKRLNPNSYNIRLGNKLKVYKVANISLNEIEAEATKPFKEEYMKVYDSLKDSNMDLDTIEYEIEKKVKDITDRVTEEKEKILRKYSLDPKKDNETIDIDIPEEGFILVPGMLYLGETMEYTETYNLIPNIDGRSTTGRLGIEIHKTAGFGDVGFKGKWTLEITVTHPVIIYPGMEIGQIYYETIEGDSSILYNGKYQNQQGVQAAKVDK